jgi:uncharacterized protein YbjT (DUF2867 family)
MKILICGGTGFIGQAFAQTLSGKHDVFIGSRNKPEIVENWRKIDFSIKNDWDNVLNDIDLVINAIGIVEGDFERVQTKSPTEMFAICQKKGIKIIHISAVGAEKENINIPFLKTKKATDDFLLQNSDAKIIYPGIVVGSGGLSTQFFAEIAQFPLIPLPGGDISPPCIHISQLCQILLTTLENFETSPQKIFAVGEAEKLSAIFKAIKGKKIAFISVPLFIIRLIFNILPNFSFGIFNKNMFAMLTAIRAEDYPSTGEKTSEKIRPEILKKSNYVLQTAALAAIFTVWFWSGVSSLISYQQSEAMMREIGARGVLIDFFIIAGSLADIMLAFGIFIKKIRIPVLYLQIIFISVYTLILTLLAPVYWLHPFGVIIKNIPLIVLSFWAVREKIMEKGNLK